MNYRFFEWGTKRFVISQPTNRAYGHLILDVLMSLHVSKSKDAKLYFIKPGKSLNSVLFEIQSDQVEIINRKAITSLVKVFWILFNFWRTVTNSAKTIVFKLQRGCQLLFGMFLKKSNKFLERRHFSSQISDAVRHRLDEWSREQSTKNTKVTPRFNFHGLDFRYLYAKSPIQVRLPDSLLREAIKQAAEVGLDPTSKIVSLHVRESGYNSVDGVRENSIDSIRNINVESYFQAVDILANHGYRVVRVGDSSMTPVRHPAVLDLATSELRTDLLEFWCIQSSRFFIGCDSGPICMTLLTNVPSLQVNVCELISSYPLRKNDLYIVRRPIDRRTGRTLFLKDMLSEEYILTYRKAAYYEFPQNTDEDIRMAAEEMLETLEGKSVETAEQREYKDLFFRLQEIQKIKDKWVSVGFPSRPYAGDGRVAHFYAKRYLQNSANAVAV